MKPYFNMKVLTLGVAMALSTHKRIGSTTQHRTRPLQKNPSPDSRNLNKDFRLFLFQISTDSTHPPLIPP